MSLAADAFFAIFNLQRTPMIYRLSPTESHQWHENQPLKRPIHQAVWCAEAHQGIRKALANYMPPSETLTARDVIRARALWASTGRAVDIVDAAGDVVGQLSALPNGNSGWAFQ